jgi:hypothetical protein
MTFDKIEKYFQTKEGLADILVECTPVFDMIDDYSTQLIQNVLSTIDEFKEMRTKLAGAIMFLNPVYSTAITIKKNEEMRFFVEKKREIENKPPTIDEKGKAVKEKFVSGAVEGEASEHVAAYRRVRNILDGYLKAAWAGISDADSRIENLKKEYKQA